VSSGICSKNQYLENEKILFVVLLLSAYIRQTVDNCLEGEKEDMMMIIKGTRKQGTRER